MKLSLIVCSRNRSVQLRRMLTQLDLDAMRANEVELVLVDSDSSDDTSAAMTEFARIPGLRVRAFRAMKKGLGLARNVGIANATGDLLAFTDDDCYLADGYFDALIAAFARPDVHYGMGDIRRFNPLDDVRIAGAIIGTPSVIPPKTLLPTGVIQGANMFFRKEVFAKVGPFREYFGAGTPFPCEDIEMGFRASQGGFTGVLVPSVKVLHDHGRRAGSPEADATVRDYDVGRGAYYACALADGHSDFWRLWHAKFQGTGRLSLDDMEQLEREMRGAADYLAYRAAAVNRRKSDTAKRASAA